jgi:DNA polymerase-3 subunit alpha/error-prone DNA polymerase
VPWVARAIASGVTKVKTIFFISCAQQDIPSTKPEIYRQIESFAGYSFCRHTLLRMRKSYQSLYLKVYPIEFMVAVINNQGGFIEPKFMCMKRKCLSYDPQSLCQLNLPTLYCQDVYLGFMHLQGLAVKIQAIVRKNNSRNYLSLEDFCNRVTIGLESLNYWFL